MNISSIIIRTSDKYIDKVVASIKESNLCDYHTHDEKGCIVATIEASGRDQEMERFKKIEMLSHVDSVALIYSYDEDEQERE